MVICLSPTLQKISSNQDLCRGPASLSRKGDLLAAWQQLLVMMANDQQGKLIRLNALHALHSAPQLGAYVLVCKQEARGSGSQGVQECHWRAICILKEVRLDFKVSGQQRLLWHTSTSSVTLGSLSGTSLLIGWGWHCNVAGLGKLHN